MLNRFGFDAVPLISRSNLHSDPHENDLINYGRLRRLSLGAKALVFDGGYVFDSIYRTIMDNSMNGIWIRRGLWQPTQDNSIALDREKIFNRVIIPQEAFDELNDHYSHGDHIKTVGPIVQRTKLSARQRSAIRQDLAQHLNFFFEHLIVTMLGGGVAADRSAQLNAVAAIVDDIPKSLNLIVSWPTATIEPGLHSWKNTRVVRTHHASTLVASSDLLISAVGYNSFHEALYNKVPTIFLPQSATFMDDQQRRGRAAVDRGLAALIEPKELFSLSDRIAGFLHGDEASNIRKYFKTVKLPTPGNSAAASLIHELLS